jgi:hypothetical protein
MNFRKQNGEHHPETEVNNITYIFISPKEILNLTNAIIKVLKNNWLRDEMGNNVYEMMPREHILKQLCQFTE